MNIQNLRYLAAIEQYGSLSAASKHLFVSQPYLSRVVRSTEEQFRIVLFTRERDGLLPTEQGRYFLEMARRLIQAEDRFLRAMHTPSDTAALKISAFPTSYAIAAYLRMLQDMPDRSLRFRYKEEPIHEVIQDVYTRDADLGIIFLRDRGLKDSLRFFESRRMVCRKVFDTQPHVLVRTGHPLLAQTDLQIGDLYRYNLVMFQSPPEAAPSPLGDGYYNDQALADLLDFDRFNQIVSVRSRGTMHNILAHTDYLALGNQVSFESLEPFGLCTLPFPFPAAEADPGRYSNSLYCIHLKDHPMSPIAQQYLDYLMDRPKPVAPAEP